MAIFFLKINRRTVRARIDSAYLGHIVPMARAIPARAWHDGSGNPGSGTARWLGQSRLAGVRYVSGRVYSTGRSVYFPPREGEEIKNSI